MRMHCRLREIMWERRLTVDELHRRAHVGREAIAALRCSRATRVNCDVLGRICETLNVTLNDLFVPVLEDN